jgi:hypothetical protein
VLAHVVLHPAAASTEQAGTARPINAAVRPGSARVTGHADDDDDSTQAHHAPGPFPVCECYGCGHQTPRARPCPDTGAEAGANSAREAVPSGAGGCARARLPSSSLLPAAAVGRAAEVLLPCLSPTAYVF